MKDVIFSFQLTLEASLLLGKIYYYQGAFQTALNMFENAHLESVSVATSSTRLIHILAEAYAMKGKNLSRFPDHVWIVLEVTHIPTLPTPTPYTPFTDSVEVALVFRTSSVTENKRQVYLLLGNVIHLSIKLSWFVEC